MKTFKVTEFIILKLEDDRTNLYVNGKRYIQCTQLVLNIPLKNFKKYESIESIDDAAEIYENTENKSKEEKISAEDEFWGHYSNIQSWVENDYDTKLLHTNLAFPLLKKNVFILLKIN